MGESRKREREGMGERVGRIESREDGEWCVLR